MVVGILVPNGKEFIVFVKIKVNTTCFIGSYYLKKTWNNLHNQGNLYKLYSIMLLNGFVVRLHFWYQVVQFVWFALDIAAYNIHNELHASYKLA